MSQWVGAALPRKEDRRMLLGRGRFTADVNLGSGLLHAAFVRSPHAHARINAIHTAAAIKADGVVDVVTAASLGHPYLLAMLEREEFTPTRMPILAGETARFVGEPVAVVIADDPYRAEDAIELVEVDWDPRPAVTSIEGAGAPAAPDTWQAMGEDAASRIDPPDDTHGSSEYRRRLTVTLVSRALAEAAERSGDST